MQIKHRHISGELPLSVLIHAAKIRALEQMGRFRENAFRSVTHDVSGPANAPTVFGCGSQVQLQTCLPDILGPLACVLAAASPGLQEPAPRFTPQPETGTN
jgi:hypothetical protein